MARHAPSPFDDELLRRVTRVVARVILAHRGRSVTPAPDEALFERHLDAAADVTPLVLALQGEFDVTLQVTHGAPQKLATVRAIAELVARSK